jgi:hypothetical protein
VALRSQKYYNPHTHTPTQTHTNTMNIEVIVIKTIHTSEDNALSLSFSVGVIKLFLVYLTSMLLSMKGRWEEGGC